MRRRIFLAWMLLGGLLTVPSGCSMPDPIRVMTFNIRYGTAPDGPNHWELRRDLVIETIRAHDPDVVGLQEVLADQAEAICDALPDYAFVGVGRRDGALAGEFVPIMYRKELFLATDTGHFWLSEHPNQPGSVGWDAALPRLVTWVQLRFKKNALNEIYVFNTHFDHRGSRARLEASKLLRRVVDSKGGTPIIVLGDFNCGPNSAPYWTLTGDTSNLAELRDPYVMLKRNELEAGTYHAFNGRREGQRIDWVLHNHRFEPQEVEIDHRVFDGRYPSDHFPVTATLRLLPATDWGVL
ncbi:MAG: endonuclease/exonuclease/phosphatase family protein [Planctomycetes bacterium]|nr:endonuclease/exonuclease/phosphatase family protein [Planctomycetota bacterium]